MKRVTDWLELLFVIGFVVACHVVKKNDPVNFDKQGHRGARGLMPENTVPAMYKALDLGVTTLEMDVVITRDRQVILSHEPFFSHEITTTEFNDSVSVSQEKGLNIFKMTYEETRRFDVGLKPHRRFPNQEKIAVNKPLLSELIDSVENYCRQKGLVLPQYNVETKSTPFTDNIFHPTPAEFVELVIGVIKTKGIEKRTIIQSFDFRTLQYLHGKYPEIRTAALIEDYDKRTFENHLQILGFEPSIYSPHYSLVNEELVKKCHGRNVKVIPWTVNDKSSIDRLRALGVDGIITDYPNLF